MKEFDHAYFMSKMGMIIEERPKLAWYGDEYECMLSLSTSMHFYCLKCLVNIWCTNSLDV